MSNENNNKEAIKKKQIRNLAIVLVAIMGVLIFMYAVIKGSHTKTKANQNKKTEFASAIKHIDAGSVLIERTESRLAQAEKITEGLQKNIDELNREKLKQEQNAPKEQEKFTVLTHRIEELEKKLNESHTASTKTGETFPGAPGVPGQQLLMTQGIRDDAIILSQPSDSLILPTKNPKDYVPSGTFVKAVTLGGADASAAVNAQSNPQPMLFRIIEDGTLPNNQKSHLKGCLATAAVVGDISSERGFIRLETLSCADPETKKIIDLNVEGTVFGPEGKSGVRGMPMWREGALLQRAFAAGALSGLASGISQKYTQTSISPLGAVQSVSSDAKDILARGAANGIGNAMEKLADYNIKRAEQYHPVLQLSAGTTVDIVFLKGFYLNDPKQDPSMQAIPSRAGDTVSLATNQQGVSNMGNLPQLPLTSSQIEKLKEHEAELRS